MGRQRQRILTREDLKGGRSQDLLEREEVIPKFCYRLTFKPFKNAFYWSPWSNRSYFETQMGPYLKIIIIFGTNIYHIPLLLHLLNPGT